MYQYIICAYINCISCSGSGFSYPDLSGGSCLELRDAGFTLDGVYEIKPRGMDGVLKVLCDQTKHGGGR